MAGTRQFFRLARESLVAYTANVEQPAAVAAVAKALCGPSSLTFLYCLLSPPWDVGVILFMDLARTLWSVQRTVVTFTC